MTVLRDHDLAAGTRLDGRFRLVRELASGAMGAVWEAIDETGGADGPPAGTPVAIKLLRPELDGDASIRRRFRREASVLRSIEHPAVVRVFAVSPTEGARSYTVMELLRGDTLEAVLAARGPLDATSLAPFVASVCEGLEAVHAQGVVHGDLKPANLFWMPDGACAARIVDFGLSKVEGLERLTRTGELTGTPVYMAPELLRGATAVDGRIDQYALGVVLHQALSGRLPFSTRKHPGALVLDIVMGRGEPLSDAAPSVPAPVRDVVAKAMDAHPDRRFGSIAALGLAFVRAASQHFG